MAICMGDMLWRISVPGPTVAGADETVEADVGMAPPEAVEELSDGVA